MIDEITCDIPGSPRGSDAIKQIKAADRAEAALGRHPHPLVIISCTGNAADPTVAQNIRHCGAHAAWSKPFPNFTNGQMQLEVAALLKEVAQSVPPQPALHSTLMQG